MTNLRVRFAPSPTGYLHVGGARTALFNYLFARKHGGTFILRIEDTDKDRSTDENTHQILEGMRWLGLAWDEGPYHQSDGLDRHREAGQRLLAEGKAYRCFCPADLLERKRAVAEEQGSSWRYDRTCLALSHEDADGMAAEGRPYAVRFLVPEGETIFDDFVHKRTSFRHDEIEDFVLLRSEGTPTYHLSVVCDDIEMRITHVIRGDDHISNTPKQILLYLALGAEPPTFAHLPLILGPDKKRLSKRHGATSVLAYEEMGILASAMVNFLGLLGWNPGDDQEVMSLAEMTAKFSFEGVGKSGAVFDMEKLLWMSGQHMLRTPAAELRPLLPRTWDADPRLDAVIDLAKIRRSTIGELAADVARYLSDDVRVDPDAAEKHLKGDDLKERLSALREALAAAPEWNAATVELILRGLAETLGVGGGKLIHPCRVAVLGVAVSPGLFDVLAAIGRESTLLRLERLIARL